MGIDSAARNPEFQRLIRLQTEAFANSTPYHSLELPDGTEIPGLIPVSALRARLDAWPLPQDLRGKRVLDIGAASGWNSFECERRGAEVVALDYVEYDEFIAVKQLRNSKVEYVIAEAEEITPERFGYFDYVLFFGVFYHLRHPLLALENVCAVTRGLAFIESYVIDNEPDPARCHMEFYETSELGGQIDNWCGPTLSCLIAMTRAAGFARADFLYADSRRGGILAHRRHQPLEPQPGNPPPFLCSALNNRHDDIVFQPRKDEYICLSFFAEGDLTKEDVFVEIDRFGVPLILLLKHPAGHWQANVKVPPGLAPGSHHVRVGALTGGFSDPVVIRMLPPGAERRYGETSFIDESATVPAPELTLVQNKRDNSRLFRGYRNEMLACRFTHHENSPLDLSMVQMAIDGNPWPLLSVERPEPGSWQVNAKMRGLPAGSHQLRLRTSRSPFSQPVEIESSPLYL